ncbi:ATP-dependent nuclease, subunit B, partial [Listeria innocua FSL S4-378]
IMIKVSLIEEGKVLSESNYLRKIKAVLFVKISLTEN